jgi:hypothetical protein
MILVFDKNGRILNSYVFRGYISDMALNGNVTYV